jgi:flavorubredoxin
VNVLNESLAKAGFMVVNEGLKALWQPGEEALAQAFEFGETFALK